MKRRFITSIIFFLVLSVVWNVFGQEQDKVQQDKRQLSTQVQQASSPRHSPAGRARQLNAITIIQAELGKLKTAIENVDEAAVLRFAELSEEEKTRLSENVMKEAQARQTSMMKIAEQLRVLRISGPQKAESLMPIRELRVISEIAKRENATDTAGRIKTLLDRYYNEIKTIHETAVKEKAPQTARRLKNLVDRYQKELIIPKAQEQKQVPEQQALPTLERPSSRTRR